MITPIGLLSIAEGFARRIPDDASYEDERDACWLSIGVAYLRQNEFDAAVRALERLTAPQAQARFRVAAVGWSGEHFENEAARELVRETVNNIESWEPLIYRSELTKMVKPICAVLGNEAVQAMSWKLKDPFTAANVLVSLSGVLQDPGVRRETLRSAEELAKGVRNGDRDYALRWVVSGYRNAGLEEDEQRARSEMSEDLELMNDTEAQMLATASEALQFRVGPEPEPDTPSLKLKRFLDYQYNDLRVLFLTELAEAGGVADPEIERALGSQAFQTIAPARPPSIYKDPSHYTVDGLAATLFGRPVRQVDDDRSYIDGDGDFWISDVSRFLSTVQELFQNFGELAAKFTPEQVEQGLWYLLSYPFALVQQLDTEGISSTQVVALTNSMYYPFSDYYSKRDQDYPGSAFFMWWDLFCSGRGNPVLDTAAIDVLQQILSLPNPACREAALHGLSHYGHVAQVVTIIDAFLDENRLWLSAEEIAWAERCRDGEAV